MANSVAVPQRAGDDLDEEDEEEADADEDRRRDDADEANADEGAADTSAASRARFLPLGPSSTSKLTRWPTLGRPPTSDDMVKALM